MSPLHEMNSIMTYSTGHESWPDLLRRLARGSLFISGMAGSAPQWLSCRYAGEHEECLLWITADAGEAERVAADLEFFLPGRIIHFPGHDSLPFLPIAPSPDTMAGRIAALYRLGETSAPFMAVTDAPTLLEPVIPPSYLAESVEYVMAGEELDRDSLLEWFVTAGYEHVSIVQARGEFCVRGGLVDFFPPGGSRAVRLDFFGDTLEEIRFFDPLTQRSVGNAGELIILPAVELLWRKDLVERAGEKVVDTAAGLGWPAKRIHSLLNRLADRRVAEAHRALYPLFYEKPATLLDYLPGRMLAVLSEPEKIKAGLDRYCEKAREAWISARESSLVMCSLEDMVLPPEDIFDRINHMRRWYFTDVLMPQGEKPDFPLIPADGHQEHVVIECTIPDLPVIGSRLAKGEGLLGPSFERLALWREQGSAVCLICPGRRHAARMADMIAEYLPSVPVYSTGEEEAFSTHLETDPESAGIYIVSGTLSSGFSIPQRSLVVVTEEEILGTSARRARRMKRRRSGDAVTFEDLQAG